ncbi:MAG: type II toxin-antitoxin system RelE/ParE family toxin [bacterium]|jgi:toxin ParE1/3/4
MQVKWLAKALANLTDEADYIAKESPASAKAFFMHVLASVEQLKEHPHLGRAGRVAGTRELVITHYPHIVPYRIKSGSVEILRVFHTARAWPKHL